MCRSGAQRLQRWELKLLPCTCHICFLQTLRHPTQSSLRKSLDALSWQPSGKMWKQSRMRGCKATSALTKGKALPKGMWWMLKEQCHCSFVQMGWSSRPGTLSSAGTGEGCFHSSAASKVTSWTVPFQSLAQWIRPGHPSWSTSSGHWRVCTMAFTPVLGQTMSPCQKGLSLKTWLEHRSHLKASGVWCGPSNATMRCTAWPTLEQQVSLLRMWLPATLDKRGAMPWRKIFQAAQKRRAGLWMLEPCRSLDKRHGTAPSVPNRRLEHQNGEAWWPPCLVCKGCLLTPLWQHLAFLVWPGWKRKAVHQTKWQTSTYLFPSPGPIQKAKKTYKAHKPQAFHGLWCEKSTQGLPKAGLQKQLSASISCLRCCLWSKPCLIQEIRCTNISCMLCQAWLIWSSFLMMLGCSLTEGHMARPRS